MGWHWHQACERAMLKKKKNCRSLARGISHGDKFGNLIGTCGRVAADKSDNVWHWHQACEWAMLKKKIAEVWHLVFRTGTNSGTSKKNCRSLARGISHGDKFGNLKKKNFRSLARGISHGDKIGNLKKKNCRSLARGISHGD